MDVVEKGRWPSCQGLEQAVALSGAPIHGLGMVVSKLTLPLGERPRRPLIELYPPCSWSAWVSVCFCIADVFWPSVAESRIPVGDLRENVTQSDNPKGHQVAQEMTGQ